MPETEAREVLTADQVAALLQVSRRTVFRLHLPSVKIGRTRRYLREDVLRYLRDKVA